MSSTLSTTTRWGIVPVVAAAQEQSSIVFPKELEVPWSVIQHRLGVTGASGNLTTNVFYNMVPKTRRLLYQINANMSEVHQRMELWNSVLFCEMEEMVRSHCDSMSSN